MNSYQFPSIRGNLLTYWIPICFPPLEGTCWPKKFYKLHSVCEKYEYNPMQWIPISFPPLEGTCWRQIFYKLHTDLENSELNSIQRNPISFSYYIHSFHKPDVICKNFLGQQVPSKGGKLIGIQRAVGSL